MKIYLGGPINGCTDIEARGWREAAKKILTKNGHSWLDPMDRDYRGRELEPGIAAAIVNSDKEDIRKSDILLMNAPKPSYGTAMEIYFGWTESKHIIVVLPNGTLPSPWVIYHSNSIHYGSIVQVARSL